VERIRHPQKLGDRLPDPDEHDLSFVLLYDGWYDDLARLYRSIVGNVEADWECVIVDNPGDDDASERIAALEHVVHVPLRDRVGWAAGRNLGLRLATGRIVCVVDTSVELTGVLQLPDPEGVLGKWGVRATESIYHFEESDGPTVHAVEAYFMAMRRANLTKTGLFDPKFKWYRNADIDFSFQVRACGLPAIVDPSLPLVRHEHRLWATTPEAERDELSRKNFFRFRDHWADREDLLT
jgi:GT2 family glycosyltransferase